MKILAFDCASKTGWALASGRLIIESGVQDLTKKRGESNGLLFLKFRKFVSELVLTTQPDLIAYELAHYRGGAATEICVGLQTRVMEVAAEFDVVTNPVRTNSLKKWATGKGTASKNAMIAAATKFLGRQPIDDNEADAVLLALFAEEECFP